VSHVTIKTVSANGDVVNSGRTLHNAHGLAPLIWSYAGEKILGLSQSAWLLGDETKIWNIAHDPAQPVAYRVTMALTFDRYLIDPDKFQETAEHLRKFNTDMGIDTTYERQNHIGAVIWELQKEQMSRGMGFTVSVAKDLWMVAEGENERPYNIDRDIGHKFIYRDLLKL
jgi:hypothetical protein